MASEFPKLKSGDELTPWHLNIVYRELDRWRRMKFAGPVAYTGIDSASSPPTITVLGSGGGPQIALSSSSITARSGTTLGSGTVTPYQIDGTTLAATGADDYTVYNFSGTAIATAKYLVVTVINGVKVVTSVEC